jgi:hypothetical protein
MGQSTTINQQESEQKTTQETGQKTCPCGRQQAGNARPTNKPT